MSDTGAVPGTAPVSRPARSVSRREALVNAGLLGASTMVLPMVPAMPGEQPQGPDAVPVAGPDGIVDPAFAHHPLYSTAVGIGEDGKRRLLPVGEDPGFLDGTRVYGDSARARALAEEQTAWLAAGRVPGGPGSGAAEFTEMIRTALLDLHTLTTEDGGVAAGWSVKWRYHWPRDCAFAALAFARTGHTADALRVLERLSAVQQEDGRFQARYVPGSRDVPDRRGVQLDGTGWALWAAAGVLAEVPDAEVPAWFAPFVDRSLACLLDLVGGGNRLPPPSPDYWEVRDLAVSLGTAAPLLAGLYGAAEVVGRLGDSAREREVRAAAERYEETVHAHFGAAGYPRFRLFGRFDASVVFLLPPFVPTGTGARFAEDTARARQKAEARMRRPAGGLAPGEGWKRDGISWTPATALFAWSHASSGETRRAREWMRWLEEHRTPHGALPEKVLADGSPAAVAPLAWTAALVVLTAVALEGRSAEG
ncbi:glycoside hydrolase family 15 [Brevibacterium samyangense]|uniref:Glycoside hydrolase family 15 n=1 Tax=Brevibacterium samyangense TaxID=366888 RepID=A0ABP5EY50_9MICO